MDFCRLLNETKPLIDGKGRIKVNVYEALSLLGRMT
jgi:hypothetical protein